MDDILATAKFLQDGSIERAKEATIFGFALVEHFKALWAANSPNSPMKSPAHRYIFAQKRYTPDDRMVVAPNNDTIYAGCTLDLRAEPAVLRVPAIKDRYYGIQFVSAVTDDFAYVGTRTTGMDAGTFLIAGPTWNGEVPSGITRVLRSPSCFAIALMRIAVSSDEDLAKALQLEDKFELMPLSRFLNQVAPPELEPVSWPQYYDARTGDAEHFFKTLCFVMQWHEFSEADRPALDNLAKIGVVAGKTFDRTFMPADAWAAVEKGFASGRGVIAKKADNIGPVINGWSFSPRNAGHFGTDYLTRSATAWKYIYVFSPEEAIYPTADIDSLGNQLNGSAGRYMIEFPRGKTPPARFFWSLTIYDKKNGWMVKNPINRYSIGDRTAGLKPEGDGATRIYIQANSPGKDRDSNWLPAPREPFFVTLRIYGPKPEVSSGEWLVPAITRLK